MQIIWLNRHGAKLIQRTQALEHHCTLKGDKSKQGEQRRVPVLIEKPQPDAEHLEHEEWRDRMLDEQIQEPWYRNIQHIATVDALRAGKRFAT